MPAAPRTTLDGRSLTRIVATVGPASAAPAMVRRLLVGGVSVFRLNLSHGDLPTHARTLAAIRGQARALGIPAAVLADLPGPKIRLTAIKDGGAIRLRHGDPVRVSPGAGPIDPGSRPAVLHVDYSRFAADVRPGDRVLVDDGAVQLRIKAVRRGRAECTCEVGGTISGRKGVNLPETAVALAAPTPRDRKLAEWAVRHGADFVALSFVQRPDDVRALRRALARAASRARMPAPAIVAKIERPVALGCLDAIAAESDALMVARGDLAIELDFARVPVEQRRIQAACDAAAIPCIVATQMLQSMIEAPLPTRAEASDVAGAIFAGADAVMLSGETAMGRYPAESVGAMRRIALEAESWVRERAVPAPLPRALREASDPAAVLARSMAQMATDGHARAILAWTDARSIRFISQTDVPVPVYAFGGDVPMLRGLSLLRGVRAVRMPRPVDSRVFVRGAERALRNLGALRAGDRVVVATGFAGRGTERLWLRTVGDRAV